jgi:hypothetical protein
MFACFHYLVPSNAPLRRHLTIRSCEWGHTRPLGGNLKLLQFVTKVTYFVRDQILNTSIVCQIFLCKMPLGSVQFISNRTPFGNNQCNILGGQLTPQTTTWLTNRLSIPIASSMMVGTTYFPFSSLVLFLDASWCDLDPSSLVHTTQVACMKSESKVGEAFAG